jgi:hypothetical protein
MKRPPVWIVSLLVLLAGGVPLMSHAETQSPAAVPELGAAIARFAPTEITADVSRLSAGDRRAITALVEASKLMDEIYLRQAWSGNAALREKLAADTTPAGKQRLHYFTINFGPWSELDRGAPFVPGVPAEQPPGAGFYPEDMTKEQFEAWVKTLSVAEQEKARGFFWVVRRDAASKLKLVPYSQEYREFLVPAAKLLRQAAEATDNASLHAYLAARADAFASDDYYQSDVAWMDVDASVEVTIGPYETYTDNLFGYKAAFESFVTVRDDAETAKLAKFSARLQELENNLPIEPRYRNPKLGAAAPIRVVDEVFTAGDTKSGVQTAAFNLPNDERVIREKGSKRVMLKNVQEAKFEKILRPIAAQVLAPELRKELSFDAFFTHILAHELMHGLGPHDLQIAGRKTTVRQEMQELYSAIEEAKADITGLWAVQYLIDAGIVDKAMERPLYVTYLASTFRSVRFGIDEAHGRGVALQFSVLRDAGGFTYDETTGTFGVDFTKIKDAVRGLAHDILTVEAEGSKVKAEAMLQKYAVLRPELRRALDALGAVPVDIEPLYAQVR